MNIARVLENKSLTTLATGMAGTVYVTTGLKAIGRPAFIYADKKSDKETKKYTASKEFLYQLLCLGLTILMLPAFKKGGEAVAKKVIQNNNLQAQKETLIKGGKIMGDLVGSVVGLTIIAPLISHEILHPIMHALGLEKKDTNIGKPSEVYLADAKTAEQPKVDTKA